ncbi:folylpolyglutamate synthase/dihydrofolate synthase family protein [Lagierella sp.]|uniref:bifunctional folylpolyglutamate synthase/dihydrofolate synthase n=1 Tax=Lagierella sp. TaxID=2849657 RepID=UPI00262100FE|nr:folylpolyglutamate synthase/dihydrofolate synthase family protein [Lagierella sp.]
MKDIFEMTLDNLDSWEEKFLEIKKNWPRQNMDLSLDRVKAYLDFKGNPQDDLKVIHIGGTNGKGSTGTFLKSILEEAGINVGFFSSPSIISDNDAIKIGDKFISYEEFTKRLLEILNSWRRFFDVDNFLSFFEASTIIAIEYFKDEDIDIAIFEVGLGGRLDSTNVFSKKLLNIITHIGLDHLGILGNSISEIALEKSGIIQKGDLVLEYPIPREATKVIESKVKEKNGKVFKPDFTFIEDKKIGIDGSNYSYKNLEDITIKLIGENQIYNSVMAIEASKILKEEYKINIDNEDIKRGLRKAFIPGRLEWIDYMGKKILLDGAHNQDGMDGFIKFVKNNISPGFNLVVGILKDKEYEPIFKKLSTLDCSIYLTQVPFAERQLKVEEAFQSLSKYKDDRIHCVSNPIKALQKAIEESDDDNYVLVTGSLYLISKIRGYLLS